MIFTFHYWKEDEVLAPMLFQELKLYHPNDHLVVFRNDEGDNRVDRYFKNEKNVSLIHNPFSKREDVIGYLKFWYSSLIEFSFDYCIHVDPDSKLHRQVKSPPRNSLWGGSTFPQKNYISTVGAGFYLHKSVIKQIVQNKDKIEKEITYVRGTQVLPSFDSTLGYFLNSLGYTPDEWTEVDINRHWTPSLEKSNKAITHPRFEKVTPL